MIKRINLLMSHAFLRGGDESATILAALAPYMNIMIDSGAFTNKKMYMKAIKNNTLDSFDPITLDEYMEYVEKYYKEFWGYVVLDVIGDAEKTEQNYQTMLSAGQNPIPVITSTERTETAKRFIENSPRVCVAGGSDPEFGNNKRIFGRIQKAYTDTGGNALLHQLGFARFPEMLQLPMATSDASSMCSGARYGTVAMFTPKKGITNVHWKDLTSPEGRDYLSMLRKMGVTHEDLADESMYKGNMSVQSISSMYAYVQMQEFTATRNMGFFFALPMIDWFMSMAANVEARAMVISGEPMSVTFPHVRRRYAELRQLKKDNKDAFVYKLVDIVKNSTDWQSDYMEDHVQRAVMKKKFAKLLKKRK